MITFSSLVLPSKGAEPLKMAGKNAIETIVWLIGLASTIYLSMHAAYLVFLAVVFGAPLAVTDTLGYVAFVGKNVIPVIFYLSFGVAGMKALSSRQFRRLGLSLVALQVGMAIYVLVLHASLPPFTGWLV